MDIGVQIKVIYQENDLIEVRISAWNGTFAGTTDVYVGIGQLAEAAAELQYFPRDSSDAREISFGDFMPVSTGNAASLRFYCVDKAGHAYVESKIESDCCRTGQHQSVMLSLPIEAAAVDSFVQELQLEANGEIAFLKAAV